MAGCHAFLLHVEALGRAQHGRGRGRELAGGRWARTPGAARGPRTPRGKGVLHEPIPLVDVTLPVEGLDLLGRHGGRVGRGGRHGARERGIGRGREGGGRLVPAPATLGG